MTAHTALTADTEGASQLTGIAVSTLEKMRLTGGNIPYCKIGRKVVYRISDLQAFLADRVVHSTSETREG